MTKSKLETINRRNLLAGAALAPVFIGAAALAAEKTKQEMILHHVAELTRLLEQTSPEGTSTGGKFTVANGDVLALAFPPNWRNSQDCYDLCPKTAFWKLAG